MRKCGQAVAACCALLASTVCPGLAAAADDATACAELSYKREIAVPACTRLIESGQLAGVDLALHRGRE